MANTKSQAEAIRDLLVERLELYDPSMDVSAGSALWTQVVEPVFAQLGTDPFDTDIRSFLKDRVTQAYPTISAQDGDALVDLLITPLEVLLEPLKREIQIVRRGQSARRPELLRLEDARDLAANFFTEWKSGSRASGIVRVYFPQPTYATILPTVEFTTAGGLKFYPTTSLTVRPEQMLLYRSGTEYYVDVPVTSSDAGGGYNIEKGTVTSVKGISGYTRIANLSGFTGGGDAETAEELLARTRASLTERTLNVRRGIAARIESDFASVRDVEVVGYGDPEMERDIITGGGEGSVVASGVCFIVGQFVLMFSTFEDRGNDGATAISEGDEIELNFWSFLYDTETGAANEKFTISTVLFDSRASIPQMPSVLLFRISSVPSVTQPVAGSLAGVLPGVFAVVRGAGKIEISDIPGGILNPDTVRGTIEVEDGKIHIGGHYDAWLRASSSTEDSATFSGVRSESALLEGEDLVVSGESADHRHLVHRAYTITSTSSFALSAALEVEATGARAVVALVTADGASRVYTLWEMNGVEFVVGDTITDGTTTGTVTAVSSSSWADSGVERGMVLSLPRGNEEGAYRILKVDGSFLYLDIELTTTSKDQLFRVLDDVSVQIFDPKMVLVPFGTAGGDDLRTTIGDTLLRTIVNLQDYGVEVGDTVEILDGDDVGTYSIQSWDSDYGGTGPVVESAMTATNSSISYKVYRTTQSVQRPLLRVQPAGVALLDASGQDSGYTIPYALPVDARSKGAFSGSRAVAAGLNGFVLMDPGDGWAPTGDYATDIATFDWATWTGGDFEDFYTEEKFTRLITDAAVEENGYIAVISVHGSDGQMYLESNLPDAAKNFLSSMRDWLLAVISTFNFGGDEEELVNAFGPLKFGPNADTALPLLLQFEILIPFEVFDGCNNVFVALPEFDWENEFEDADTFDEAIGRFNNGEMSGRAPALLRAQAGDVLTVLSGQNAGSYIVDSVRQYYLINGGAVVDGGSGINLDNAYQVALVVIRSEFPVPAFQGLPEFFSGGSYSWSLPATPDLPFTVTDEYGNSVDGWDWVETALTWFFQLLTSLGFDLPEDVSLDVPETLKAFWQLLFNDYVVGRPTASQYVRMYFQEPTSVTVYAPQVCARYQWAPPVHAPIVATGAEFTLPLAELDGMAVELNVETLTEDKVLSGTLTADAATAATVEALAAILQAVLDPAEEYVLFSGPATATGALTITTVPGGVDTYLYVTATDVDDGFRWLGFYDGVGFEWAEVESTPPAAYLATHVALDPAVTAGVRISHTTGTGTYASDVNVSAAVAVAGDYTFVEIAAILATRILAGINFWGQVSDAAVAVTWDDTTNALVVEITGTEITAASLTAPSGLTDDLMLALFGAAGPIAATGGTPWEFATTTPSPFSIGDLSASVVTTIGTFPVATTLTYTEAVSFDDGIEAAALGAFDDLAAALNAFDDAHSLAGTRHLWFVGGASLTARTVAGGGSTSVTLDAAASTGYAYLGFPDPSTDTGNDVTGSSITRGVTTAAGDTTTAYQHPRAPTFFTTVVGAAELLFTPSLEADAYQVFPGQTDDGDGDTPVQDLPRDLIVGTPYDDQLSAECVFTDTSYGAPLELDIHEEDDWLYVYEQRVLLEFTTYDALDTDLARDRVVAVFTEFGSNVVEIPDFSVDGANEFTFLAPNSGEDDDQVQVGDILFIEEGDDEGGYVVTARTATTLTLDRALTTSTEKAYRCGNDGALVVDISDAKFTSATALFTSDDVGRYLTLWACNRDEECGSYPITAVETDGSGCTLDTDVFPESETDVHWAVVKAPTDEPGDSGIAGRTALVGLRPVRIYSGEPGKFRVVQVTPELDRTEARVFVALDESDEPPENGVRQPYKFVRPGAQHISSTTMAAQRERGLFYFDVLAHSLGGDDLYNVPQDVKFEPVYGTYDSDGYRLDVADNRYTFSTQEETVMVVSATFLPSGLDDQLSNLVVLDSRSIRVDYEYVPVVAQVQSVLSSETDRVLCANALARHFLPAYVYFDLSYSGGNAVATIASGLIDYMEGLSAIDELDVSRLEKILHRNGVTRYDHPVRIITLTHDLDRRIVGTQSDNVINDAAIAYNGTNRTTFFIPGPDQSSIEDEADVPIGERTRLLRTTVRSTFR